MISHLTHLLERYAFYLLLPLVLFFSFYRLGDQPVHQWDEARTGINAIEMLDNGDYINLYFGGEPDKIRAKPPLVIWLVAASFQTFGYNAWSLRLHSAVASVVIFLFLFMIVRLYESDIFALTCCLILLSVRGIIGFHVGRTGDFDAVLIAFLMGGLYFFLRFLEFNYQKDIYWAALFWGLAFLTKGPAMGVLFPGILVYLVFTKRLLPLFKRRDVYLAMALCLLFPVGWYLTVHFYGVQLEKPEVSGSNAFERMFLYDLLDRFTQTQFEGKTETSNPLFFFQCLKENFAVWHYLFYGTVLGAILLWVKKRLTPDRKIPQPAPLLVLSVCIWFTLGLFLSLVTTVKFWYLAPALPFVAVTVVYGLKWCYERFKLTPYLFLVIWLFAMYFRYLGPKPQPTKGASTPDFYSGLVRQNKQVISNSSQVYVAPELPAQRILLQLYFANNQVKYLKTPISLTKLNQNNILFIRREAYVDDPIFQNLEQVGMDDHYVVLKKD